MVSRGRRIERMGLRRRGRESGHELVVEGGRGGDGEGKFLEERQTKDR